MSDTRDLTNAILRVRPRVRWCQASSRQTLLPLRQGAPSFLHCLGTGDDPMRLPAHTHHGQHDTRCTHVTDGVPECPGLLTSAQGPADRDDCERDTSTAQASADRAPSIAPAVSAGLPAGKSPAGDYSVCPQVFFFSSMFWMYRYVSHASARLCGKMFSYS